MEVDIKPVLFAKGNKGTLHTLLELRKQAMANNAPRGCAANTRSDFLIWGKMREPMFWDFGSLPIKWYCMCEFFDTLLIIQHVYSPEKRNNFHVLREYEAFDARIFPNWYSNQHEGGIGCGAEAAADWLGDWLLIGLALLALMALGAVGKQ